MLHELLGTSTLHEHATTAGTLPIAHFLHGARVRHQLHLGPRNITLNTNPDLNPKRVCAVSCPSVHINIGDDARK